MDALLTFVLNGVADLLALLKTAIAVVRVVIGLDGLYVLSAVSGVAVVVAVAKTLDWWSQSPSKRKSAAATYGGENENRLCLDGTGRTTAEAFCGKHCV